MTTPILFSISGPTARLVLWPLNKSRIYTHSSPQLYPGPGLWHPSRPWHSPLTGLLPPPLLPLVPAVNLYSVEPKRFSPVGIFPSALFQGLCISCAHCLGYSFSMAGSPSFSVCWLAGLSPPQRGLQAKVVLVLCQCYPLCSFLNVSV